MCGNIFEVRIYFDDLYNLNGFKIGAKSFFMYNMLQRSMILLGGNDLYRMLANVLNDQCCIFVEFCQISLDVENVETLQDDECPPILEGN